MPRKSRFYLPGIPAHIVQRGNNREPVFFATEDYFAYRDWLTAGATKHGCWIHAYVLMTNHVHILLTPSTRNSISRLVQFVGRNYVTYVNRVYRRTGTLWEGRHKGSLVEADKHLLACYRYIELNPVRAGMVKCPEAYKWSSYGANAWGDDSWLSPHPEYERLGPTMDQRYQAYRDLFARHVCNEDLHLIREAAHYCQPVSDDRFRLQIEEKYGLRLGQMKRGRPKGVAGEN